MRASILNVNDGNGLVPRSVAARHIGATESFLRKHERLGDGPKFYKVGRLVRYRLSDVDAWLELRCTKDAGISAERRNGKKQ
jgi:predicted DNA-binding transcriptional regulator AlpA